MTLNKTALLALEALFAGGWVFLLLVWGYICLDIIVHPETQLQGLSYYFNVPQNLLAMTTFPAACALFVPWYFLRVLRLRRP